MSELPKVPGMKQTPMDATKALRTISNVVSNLSPNNPHVLNALTAERALQNIVAAAQELVGANPLNLAEVDKLRKALAGEA